MTEAPPPLLPPTIRTRLRRIALALVVLLLAWMAASQFGPRLPAPPSRDNRPPPEWPLPPPPPPPPGMAPPSTDISLRLQALEERLARLETQSPTTGNAVDDARLLTLETQLKAQETSLAEMQRRLQKNTDLSIAMNLFYQMREAIVRGEAFHDSWDRLNAMAQEKPQMQAPLSRLAPYADTGVATLEALKAGFEAAAPMAIAGEETSVTVSNALQSLIRIRKVGEAHQGSDDESVIARAEAKLARGEVERALKELGALSPRASGRLVAWSEQAQGYVSVRKSLEELQPALQAIPSAL